MAKVAVSSTVFGRTDLQSVCRTAVEAGLPGLELSGNIQFLEDDRLANIFGLYRDQIDLFVHNYFPATKEPFVLNLSLKHHWRRSLEHCRRAIDLCQTNQLKQYSLHAGFAIDLAPSDLGGRQVNLTAVDFDESGENFFHACQQAADYAHRKGVELLIENNVVASYNCPDGINRRYNFADLEGLPAFIDFFNKHRVGVLLDVGHLQVSAQTLRFDKVEFVRRVRPLIRAVHLSDNNACEDQNLPVTERSWFWEHLPWKQIDYVSFELRNVSVNMLREQIDLLKPHIKC